MSCLIGILPKDLMKNCHCILKYSLNICSVVFSFLHYIISYMNLYTSLFGSPWYYFSSWSAEIILKKQKLSESTLADCQNLLSSKIYKSLQHICISLNLSCKICISLWSFKIWTSKILTIRCHSGRSFGCLADVSQEIIDFLIILIFFLPLMLYASLLFYNLIHMIKK